MYSTKRQHGSVWYRIEKDLPVFHLCAVGCGYAFAIMPGEKHLWTVYGGFGGRSRLRLQGDWFSRSYAKEERRKKGEQPKNFPFFLLTSFIFILFFLSFIFILFFLFLSFFYISQRCLWRMTHWKLHIKFVTLLEDDVRDLSLNLY